MSVPDLLLVLIAAGLSAAWLLYGGLAFASGRRLRFLEDLLREVADEPLDRAPSLSVVVTARDEAAAIEATVKSLLRQRHPALEIVVVDDRSSDGTGAILDR